MLLEFDGTFLFALISFIIFVFLMNLILYRPIVKIIDERQKFLDKNKETVFQSKQKAKDVVQKMNDEILSTKLEASNILSENQNALKAEKENEIQAKKDEIKEKLISHNNSLKANKNEAKAQLKNEINDFVKMSVSKILEIEIDEINISEDKIARAMEGQNNV